MGNQVFLTRNKRNSVQSEAVGLAAIDCLPQMKTAPAVSQAADAVS